jgi:hypothetical protein
MIILAQVECSLCGARSEQQLTDEMDSQGLPDLDSRPAESARSMLGFWVQRCPHCGYCATDISLDYPLADVVMCGEEYRKLLRRRTLPEKAADFLAWGLIQEANEESGGAGWAALHAAWVCDDVEDLKAATECRKLALERFARQRARQGHITGFEDPGVEELVLADLSRRIKQLGEAARWVETGLKRQPGVVVRRALEMERDWIARKNLNAHSMQELLHNS